MTRRLVRRAGAGKAALLLALSLLFALADRAPGDTFGGHLAQLLSDENYFAFAVLPIVLLFFGSLMEDDPGTALIRHGTYFRYFLRKWRSECLLALALWAGQLAVLAVSGLGLPTGGWGRQTNILRLLAGVFPGPAAAVFCAAVHLLLGYWLIALLTLWLGHFLPRTGAVRTLAGLYALAILQTKLPSMSRPPLGFVTGLDHWVLLVYNLTYPWRLPLTMAVTAVFAAAALISTKLIWQRKRLPSGKRPRGLGAYCRRAMFSRKNLLFALGLTAVLVGWTLLRLGGVGSGREWTAALMAGQGAGRLYFPGILSQLLSQLLPLWPPAALISEALGGRSVMLAVRLSRRRELTSALLGTALVWLALWSGLTLAALVLPPELAGAGADLGAALTAAAVRGLDMVCQLLLLLVLMPLTGAGAGFAVLAAAHFMGALPVRYWPVGISGRLGDVSPALAALETASVCALAALWLRLRGGELLFERCGDHK